MYRNYCNGPMYPKNSSDYCYFASQDWNSHNLTNCNLLKFNAMCPNESNYLLGDSGNFDIGCKQNMYLKV